LSSPGQMEHTHSLQEQQTPYSSGTGSVLLFLIWQS
jgi:hypothetical protein